MKIVGIFRGFPGLGRVIAGTELLETLRDDYGCEVMAFSYLQGARYLNIRGIKQAVSVPDYDICPLGILPTGYSAARIVEAIQHFSPDCFFIDGEPLLLQQMRICFPSVRIVTLLNPSDIDNAGIHESHIRYFRHLYSMADLTLVHGLRYLDKPYGFDNFVSTKTILRREIGKIVRNAKKLIYCVLGGGTVNVDEDFLTGTLSVAVHCIKLMKRMPEFRCVIVCACEKVAERVKGLVEDMETIEIRSDYVSPGEYYGTAALIITRAGRNTLSELVYLGVPAIAFMTGGRFRAAEQSDNARHLSGCVVKMPVDISEIELLSCAKRLLAEDMVENVAAGLGGREEALDAVCRFLNLKRGCDD